MLAALHSIDPDERRSRRPRSPRRLRRPPAADVVRVVDGVGRVRRLRRPARARAARRCCRRRSPNRVRRGSCTATSGRTTRCSRRRATSRPCSTGSWPRSAIRSPTSPTRSTPGPSPATRACTAPTRRRRCRAFPTRAELIARYAAITGADLSNLAYYRAFNSWKTACILHGVYARYQAGQKSTEGVDLEAPDARGSSLADSPSRRPTRVPGARMTRADG